MDWQKLKELLLKQNRPGDRLKWVREKLDITIYSMISDVGVGRYVHLEYGGRTPHYETILYLAQYYNAVWQKKFKDNYPVYNGKEIKKITDRWIYYGSDLTLDEYEQTIKELKEEFKIKEDKLVKRIKELESIAKV